MPPEDRPFLSALLAGIVTPALAMLFEFFGAAIYQGDHFLFTDFPAAAQLALDAAVVAAIFGAPLAIPVALAIRLENIWKAVPSIALGAAFGIAVQIQIRDRYNDSVVLSLMLMLFWIVPTVFGIVVALLLKWRERESAVAIGGLATAGLVVLAIIGTNRHKELAPAYSAAKTWSELRVGMNVFTGDDGNGVGETVCPTLSAILVDQLSGQCGRVPPGSPAVVDEIIPCEKTDPDWGWESPHVRIHSVNGSWAGFVDAAMLQPSIPEGTLIELRRDWGAPLTIDDDHGRQTSIGDTAMVRLLRYDPKKAASLYVKILDGPYRGRTGWTWIQAADTGGVALGEYSLQYGFDDCS
ncbi:MAG TPA: hypothetical protein VEV38_01500 [Candidatus Eremiobacteraceae bacterium]|nr:hypothetical protein [Candidatus Eremiobacteraceae bacterium]